MRRASGTGLTLAESKEMEKKILMWLKMAILREGRVVLRSFGIFKLVLTKAKLVTTPGDGEVHRVAPVRKVKFKTWKRWER